MLTKCWSNVDHHYFLEKNTSFCINNQLINNQNSRKRLQLKSNHFVEKFCFKILAMDFFKKYDFGQHGLISIGAISTSFHCSQLIVRAKHICFSWKKWWSTFDQHLVNICCPNMGLKMGIKGQFTACFSKPSIWGNI